MHGSHHRTCRSSRNLGPDEAIDLYEQMKAPEVMTIAESLLDLLLGHQFVSKPIRRSHDSTAAPASPTSSPRTATPSPSVAPGHDAA